MHKSPEFCAAIQTSKMKWTHLALQATSAPTETVLTASGTNSIGYNSQASIGCMEILARCVVSV